MPTRSRVRPSSGVLRVQAPVGDGYTFPTTAYNFPVLPDDGGTAANDGFMNVADYGLVANNSGGTVPADNSAALHTMIQDNLLTTTTWSNKTIFFPNGTWYFSGLGTHTRGIIEYHHSSAGWCGGMRIQGQSESGTILRLVDNDADFQDTTHLRFFIFQSNYESAPGGGPHSVQDGTGLEGYENIARDFTIDLGAGNDGAVGMNIMMHNVGAVRRVTVQDAVGAGRSANDADRAMSGFDELRQGAGPNHLHRLTAKGMKYGFRIGQVMCGQGIEHLKLENQSVCGIVNDSNGLFIRGLVSNQVGAVPVAEIQTGASINHFSNDVGAQWVHTLGGSQSYFDGTNGYLLIVDAVLTGTGAASGISAIRNQTDDGKMFLRNVTTTGYARAAEENASNVPGTSIVEYCTGPQQYLWGAGDGSEAISLDLPILDTPEKPWSTAGEWTDITTLGIEVSHNGGSQFTNAWADLQTAIDNCTTDTLYFPPAREGRVKFSGSGTIHVRGSVRHIVGFGCEIAAVTAGQTLTIVYDHTDRPVGQECAVWEDIRGEGTSLTFTHKIDTPRDIVVLDSYGDFMNTVGATGTVFGEDIVGGNPNFDFAQDCYLRQPDPDGGNFVTKYSGGNLWAFYVKSEPKSDGSARMLPTSWTGNIEIVGAWMGYVVGGTATSPMWEVNNATAALDAELSVLGCASSLGGSSGDWATFAKETQNGTVHTCIPAGNAYAGALAPRGAHYHLTLYRSKKA